MNEMPQLDQLIAAIREEASRPEYQVSAAQPMLPMSEVSPSAQPSRASEANGRAAAAPPVFRHVDELLLISDSALFIDAAYHALLLRPADALGAQNYRGKLDQGYGQMFVLAALQASDESRLLKINLAGFGIAPLVYNGWRLGRRIGLTGPARLLSNAYSGWRHLRLAASGRLSSQLGQTGNRLNQVEAHQQNWTAATAQTLYEVAQAQKQEQHSAALTAQRLDEVVQIQRQDQQRFSERNVRLDELQRAQGAFEAQNRFELQLLRARISTLQQRALVRTGASPVLPSTVEQKATSGADHIQQDLDDYYLAFENANRGSRAEIITKITPYLAKVAALAPEVLVLPMVDMGCGRGEWLELLREQGFEAIGLDLSPAMVQHCLERGLHAEHGDAQHWLARQSDNSFGMVSGFHIVEHLPFEQLFQLIGQIWRVMAPGGILVLETPNPENVLVGSHTFYHDHSHRNPVTPTSLQFLLGYHGFVAQEVIRLNPYPEKDRIKEPGLLTERFNGHMYGPQDYGIVARKT
jgi:SAM-dependent methyltransferase